MLTPTFRYNPAVIAQAFATMGCLYPDRVMLGAGTGEVLNEIAIGHQGEWPPFKGDREVEPGSGQTGVLAYRGPMPLGYYKDTAKTSTTFRTIAGVRYAIPGRSRTRGPGGLGRTARMTDQHGPRAVPASIKRAGGYWVLVPGEPVEVAVVNATGHRVFQLCDGSSVWGFLRVLGAVREVRAATP